jgi:plasmid stabilization system protein ParE
MAEIKIFWTLTAIKQRNIIFEYWNERNKSTSYSKKLNYKIKERINLLKANPNLGKPSELLDYRGISLGHYSIFYKQLNEIIYITAIWDNRQSPKKLLKLLKP